MTDFQDGTGRIDLREENGRVALAFDQLLIRAIGTTARIQLDLDRDGVADVIDLNEDGVADQARINLLNTSILVLSVIDFIL